jgi:hypothetical protein
MNLQTTIFWILVGCIFVALAFFAGAELLPLQRRQKWKLRVRWGYLTHYGLYRKFAHGFAVGPFLLYKSKDMVYYRWTVDSEVATIWSEDISKMLYETAKKKLFESVPFDFGFTFIERYSDYDIDRDLYRFTIAGFPHPKHKENKR